MLHVHYLFSTFNVNQQKLSEKPFLGRSLLQAKCTALSEPFRPKGPYQLRDISAGCTGPPLDYILCVCSCTLKGFCLGFAVYHAWLQFPSGNEPYLSTIHTSHDYLPLVLAFKSCVVQQHCLGSHWVLYCSSIETLLIWTCICLHFQYNEWEVGYTLVRSPVYHGANRQAAT